MTYETRERPINPWRAERTGMGWGIPLIVAALVLVGGFFLYNSLADRNTTIVERNNQAPITTNVPTQTPAPIPAPSNAPVR